MASKLDLHAKQLGALGSPVRLAILRFAVKAGPDGASAGDIQAHVDLPPSTLSYHLRQLVEAGVIQTRGEGSFHYYSASYDALRALTDYLWEDCCKGGGKSKCC